MLNGKFLTRAVALAMGVTTAMTLPAIAQEYPERPIRLIIPYPASTSNTNIVGRTVADRLPAVLGQNVVIENIPGANGAIGVAAVVNADPDGYTLLLTTGAPVVLNQLTKDELPADPALLEPVSLLTLSPFMIGVPATLPVETVTDLIELAKSKPGELHYASAGIGGTTHLAGELFNNLAGTEIVHVPYPGTGPAMPDLLAGRVDMFVTSVASLAPSVETGQLKGLAIGRNERTPLLPDMPTAEEAGLPGYEVYTWVGIMAPPGTPKEIIDTLHAAVAEVMESPGTIAFLEERGAEPALGDPEEFQAYLNAEMERWGGVVEKMEETSTE